MMNKSKKSPPLLMTNKLCFSQLITNINNQLSISQTQMVLVWQLLFYHSKQVQSLTDYFNSQKLPIDFDYDQFIQNLNQLLVTKTPIARIMNKTYFCNQKLVVFKDVFIPRPETELLVQITAKAIKKLGLSKVCYLDLCTGTGAIGLIVHHQFPKLQTTLVDQCPKAISNAKINAQNLQLKVNLVCADWKQYLSKIRCPTIITANFPYVGYDHQYDQTLLFHEPAKSLFAANQGWEHYQKLINYLKTNHHWKLVVLETTPYHQKQWTKVQLLFTNWNIALYEDWQKQLRVVKISKK